MGINGFVYILKIELNIIENVRKLYEIWVILCSGLYFLQGTKM